MLTRYEAVVIVPCPSIGVKWNRGFVNKTLDDVHPVGMDEVRDGIAHCMHCPRPCSSDRLAAPKSPLLRHNRGYIKESYTRGNTL